MATLKDHQATMVSMLASGTAIPTSAIRLAHALHDVLAYLNDTNVAPVAHTERRIDATTPGLNDALLAEAIKACSGKIMSGDQKQSEDFATRWNEKHMRQLVNEARMVKSAEQSLESLLKQRDNTIRQLKVRVADLVKERDHYKDMLGADPAYFEEPQQAGCKHSWKDTGRELYCRHCGVHPSDLPEQAGCRKDDTQLPDDGWVEWGGGECPCDYRTVVEVRLRSGNEREARGALSWEWKHYNSICDIIAYRIVGDAK